MTPVETQTAPKFSASGAGDSQLLHSSLLAFAHANGDGPSGPPGLSATPTLSNLVQAVKRRWLLAFGVAIAAAAAFAVGVFFVHPPKYHVTLEVRIVAKQASAEDIEFPIFKASMEAMVKNPIVLSNALNDKTTDGREVKDLEIIRSKGMSAVDWLRKNLKTDYLLGPEVLRVTLPADDPTEASELLNAISNAFLKEYAEMETAKKQQRLAELKGKKDLIERDLHAMRGTLDRLVKNLDVKDQQSTGVQVAVLQSRLAAAETAKRALEDEINKARSEVSSAERTLKNIDKYPVPDDILFEAYSKDQILIDANKRLSDIEREMAEYERKFNQPFLDRAKAPLIEEKSKLNALKDKREQKLKPDIEQRYRRQVADSMRYKIEVAEDKIVSGKPLLEKEIINVVELTKKVQDAAAGNLNDPPQIQAARQNLEIARMSLNSTAQKITDIENEPLVSRVIPLQRPGVPLDKDRSQQTKIAGAGGLGIFIMALFAVGFYEFRSRRIGMADDVTRGLGLSVIGTLPAMPARTKNPTAKSAAQEQRWLASMQEAVDSLRTVILHQARSRPLNVFMITSAQGGEGKTTLATQLAASLARAWKRVLIIDADLRHPGAHALFDVPQEPGLAEVLRSEVDPADAIRATPVSRLWVLPAGNGDAHAIQALAQDNVRTLFEQLKLQYDFIIIDTPPLLPVADGLLIGQHVDGVLWAILSEVSRAPAVYAAQQKIAPLGVHTVGAVVLGAQTEFGETLYGYGLNQPKN